MSVDNGYEVETHIASYTTPSEMLMHINNNVIRLNVQMENMLHKIDEQNAAIKNLEERVSKLEMTDGVRAQNMWKQVLGGVIAVITTVLGAFFVSRIPPIRR